MKQQDREEWVRLNTCRFCIGSHLHSCTGYDCRDAVKEAENCFEKMQKLRKEEKRMFKVKFILKNSVQIEVFCKNIKVTTSELTGKITAYKIEEIEGLRPMYINIDEITAITLEQAYQFDDEEDEE